jgi:hypothetical protein
MDKIVGMGRPKIEISKNEERKIQAAQAKPIKMKLVINVFCIDLIFRKHLILF